jgi:cell fate regulator YaaT (PSP1 superfamily)
VVPPEDPNAPPPAIRPEVFLAQPPAEPAPDPGTIIDPVPWNPKADGGFASEGVVHNLVSVRVERTGRCYDYDAGDAVYRKGDIVAVEGDTGGIVFGLATGPSRRAVTRLRPRRALRKASEQELHAEPRGGRREKEVFRIAKHVAGLLDLPIKIVRADTEPNGRTTVYFASEDRIDFRELHRRVSAAAQGRVELRQVGVRDAAKMTGGVGPCGQHLCCSRFLREFAPISIKMAKEQGLVLNPQRVSGLCGRLLCCLTFEDQLYRTQRKLLPKLGKRVLTPKGPGKVRDVDVLSQTVRVFLENGEIAAFKPTDIAPMFPAQTGGHGGPAGDGHDDESGEAEEPETER